jgi:hypothetical protein
MGGMEGSDGGGSGGKKKARTIFVSGSGGKT